MRRFACRYWSVQVKIAFVTDTYTPEINGVVTSIVNFSEFLAARGHEVLIIAPKYDKKSDEEVGGIRIKRYPSFSYAANKNTRIAYPFLVRMRSELKDFEPDIVHIQTPLGIGVTGLLAARMLNLPSIQTYHTYIPDFMTYVNPYRVLGLDKVTGNIANLKAVRRVLESDFVERAREIEDESAVLSLMHKLFRGSRASDARLTDRFAWDFTRTLYNRSDLVLTPSEVLAKILRKHRIKAPVTAVSNGVDFEAFEKKTDYAIGQRLINVGRLGVEGKNVDQVIEAFALTLRSRPEMTLDIAGDGPARKSLERLAVRLGIAERVNFLGFVSLDTLKEKYRDHDAFVTASTIETQGLVILEAMSAGLPILGVDALAIPECVKNDRNGYLVAPSDLEAMADAMVKLTESAERNRQFGAASLEIARAHDVELCGERLEEIYREVIAGASKSGG